MLWYFFFFVVSGFCSLVYQVTWLRVAMAAFGVTTPSISIVLSVFMAGISIGSWGGGCLVSRFHKGGIRTFMLLYGCAEIAIAFSGFIVAPLLRVGHEVLLKTGSAWGSGQYYVVSSVVVSLVLLPSCICMGATFPLAMAAVRCSHNEQSETSFSYLYVSNVLGAMAGCLLSAFVLIELLGIRGTMHVAAVFNLIIGASALIISYAKSSIAGLPHHVPLMKSPQRTKRQTELYMMILLTGVSSMAMEVVWTRQFVPFMGPVVYTFAAILSVYLGANLFGSLLYRKYFRRNFFSSGRFSWEVVSVAAGVVSLLPLVTTDYRLPMPSNILGNSIRLLLGIGPFCALLGILTPGMLDRASDGDPRRAGFAYSLNTFGCIIGPLLAGFILLPMFGERWGLLLLSMPLTIAGVISLRSDSETAMHFSQRCVFRAVLALVLMSFIFVETKGYEQMYPDGEVRRDYTATVLATGSGMNRQLLVNGYGMTFLTPITKAMVHLPVASLGIQPRNGLVLCLGMGTSYRSMLSWGITSTVVELVPSIPELLPSFHKDGAQMLRAINGHIVVDDARRYLERSSEQFDVIIVDPPPPIEAAASSLLYSVEFYDSVIRRLSEDGIFQQWIPLGMQSGMEPVVAAAMVKTLLKVFPYARMFYSYDSFGVHILASKKPIHYENSDQLAAKFKGKAREDFLEWGPCHTLQAQLDQLLIQEVSPRQLIDQVPFAPLITDDHPLNEYFLLRRLGVHAHYY